MNKKIRLAAGIFGATAVIFGAFAAHALKAILPPEVLGSFETGVRYQMYHALLLLFIPSIGINEKALKNIYRLFAFGIILFSGSIYLLALQDVMHVKLSWLGPITPIGGTLLIAGWIGIIISAVRLK